MDKRVVELDLMRFLAALAVVLFHFITIDLAPHVHSVTQVGFLGVELFFMISGFVILSVAKKTGYEFIASRISRLFPAFLCCLPLAFIGLWAAGKPMSVPMFLANMTMMPGMLHQPNADVVYWTLQLEIKFYALIFLLLICGQIKHIERWLPVWLGITILEHVLPVIRPLTLNGYAPDFIAGCYLYRIRTTGLMTRGRWVALTLCLALGISNEYHDLTTAVLQPMSPYLKPFMAVVIATMYAGFLLVALRKIHLPQWKGWSRLGALTYPLYLVHCGAVGLFVRSAMPGQSQLTHFSISIIASLAIAALIAFTVDRKGCPALNRWLLAIGKTDTPAPAEATILARVSKQ
jgi:peptidoglycan/LPS O-acetylase OafA/YrhL